MLRWLVLPIVVLAYLATTVSAGAPRDRDHDQLPDRWERKHHLSTAQPSAKRDPDRDRLKNRHELRFRTHPRRADTDRDHLPDGAEVRRFRTNPRKRDTDGDGFGDRCELRSGANPRKRRSRPKRRCLKSTKEPSRRLQSPPSPSSGDPDGDGFVGPADICPNESGASPDGCHCIVLVGGGGDSGHFGADCFYSHTNHDDPIVVPGQVGAAHMHDFINNGTTNAFSTNASLRASGSTNCVRAESKGTERNFSSYWVPALIVDGVEVKPGVGRGQIGALYTLNRRRPGNVQPFPADLKVIAGRADGGPVDTGGDQRVFIWECHGGLVQPAASPGGFPLCGEHLRLNIRFGSVPTVGRTVPTTATTWPTRECPRAAARRGSARRATPSRYRRCSSSSGTRPAAAPPLGWRRAIYALPTPTS
jgi:Domain of unknown function (DUF1996)